MATQINPIMSVDKMGNPVRVTKKGDEYFGVGTNEWGYDYALRFNPSTGQWDRYTPGTEEGGGGGGGQQFDDEGNPIGPFTKEQNSLMAYVKDLLSQFGLDTPGLVEFARNAIAKGWDANQIMLELRRQPDYLADPMFAANIERAKNGGLFLNESQVLQYRDEAKRLVNQYGFGDVSDAYLAKAFGAGWSLAEIENSVQIQRKVIEFGPAVRDLYAQYTGANLTDQDIWEIFNPEINTQERSDALRDAMYRGRPVSLGLGTRTQAEADRLRMLGVNPEEAFSRYSQVAQNASRFDRLGTIEESITGKLPKNFGDFSKLENSLLVRALVFQDPKALAELQDQTMREVGRWNLGGGIATNQAGEQLGLLTPGQR